MTNLSTSDLNIVENRRLPSPAQLVEQIDKDDRQANFVAESRKAINQIIFGDDRRLLAVVGPCSIHDLAAGGDYAAKLAELSQRVSDRMLIVMRVYFEKPRTSVGWKGLIMDPDLDGSSDIASGLATARKFLLRVLDMGLPTATELLDPITPQYIADLVSWAAIGARTTESQTHRQMASGLSMPLGFKNGTDGNLAVAINAIKAASQAQTFLGIDRDGRASAVTTRGNRNCHIVLRGGKSGPNFDARSVRETAAALKAAERPAAIMVDCSHANSDKDSSRQPAVLSEVLAQIESGDTSIIGFMLESNLEAGNQPFPSESPLKYGVSITDGCIDWETTKTTIMDAYRKLESRFALH